MISRQTKKDSKGIICILAPKNNKMEDGNRVLQKGISHDFSEGFTSVSALMSSYTIELPTTFLTRQEPVLDRKPGTIEKRQKIET